MKKSLSESILIELDNNLNNNEDTQVTKEDIEEFYRLVRNELENTVKIKPDYLDKVFSNGEIHTSEQPEKDEYYTYLSHRGDEMRFEFPGWGSVYNVFYIQIILYSNLKFKVLGKYRCEYFTEEVKRVILSGKYDIANHTLKVRKKSM